MPVINKNKTTLYISLAVILCILILIIIAISSVRVSLAKEDVKFTAVSIPKSNFDLSENKNLDHHEKFLVVKFAGIDIYINRDVPRNTYKSESFSSNDDGTKIFYGENAVYGIDVSAFQGEIDWAAVKEAGIDFAIIRLGFRGMSAGQLYTDEHFFANIDGAAAAGIDIGIYFFSQATSVPEAVEEAEYVLELLDGRELQYPIFFDWEPSADETDRTYPIYSSPVINEFAVEFCNVVQNAGYDGGIYFNNYQGYLQYDFTLYDDEVLWLAEYGSEYPKFYYEFDMWQYSCTGNVSGIDAAVDLNIFIKD